MRTNERKKFVFMLIEEICDNSMKRKLQCFVYKTKIPVFFGISVVKNLINRVHLTGIYLLSLTSLCIKFRSNLTVLLSHLRTLELVKNK